MYLCICNAIKTSDFRVAARGCHGDAEEIYARLGKRPQCGQCLDDAEEILAEMRSAQQLPVCVAA